MSAPDAVLLDTCALIWFAAGQLPPNAVAGLARAGGVRGLYVSPISAWEIGLLSRPRQGRPRLDLSPDAQTWLTDVMARPELRLAPLTTTAAFDASFLPGPLHADPADRLLIATAREMNAALATGDENILAYADLGHVRAIAC